MHIHTFTYDLFPAPPEIDSKAFKMSQGDYGYRHTLIGD